MLRRGRNANEHHRGVGFWFLVSGFWLLVSGFWFLVSGFWLLVAGFWFLVLDSSLWFRAFVAVSRNTSVNQKPETTNQKPETRNRNLETVAVFDEPAGLHRY
jgi:hypothetical protein